MATSRRSFIKRLGAGVACAAIAPELIAAEGGKDNRTPVGRYPRLDYDVIVAGAGPGGIASAVAAARNGARVLLIEEDMTPGGAPVDMYVTFMCVYYAYGKLDGWEAVQNYAISLWEASLVTLSARAAPTVRTIGGCRHHLR